MKKNAAFTIESLFGLFICCLLLVCMVAFSSQTHTPKQLVDSALKGYKGPLPIDVPYFESYDRDIKQNLQNSGYEGFLYLIETTKKAPRNDLYRLIPLLSYFKEQETYSSELINIIRARGVNAKNEDDIIATATMYGNLGLSKMTPQVSHFLFDVITQKNQIENDWPVVSELKAKKNNAEILEIEYIIRSFAVLSLFHANTPETIAFLKEVQHSQEISDRLRQSITFYFNKMDEFGTLPRFYEEMEKSMKQGS